MIDFRENRWISSSVKASNFKASVPRRNHNGAHIMSIEAEYSIIKAWTEHDLVISLIVGRKIVVNYKSSVNKFYRLYI